MNLSMKQKQTHRHREQTCGCQGRGWGEGRTGSLGLVDVNCYIWNGRKTRSYFIAQGTIFNVLE